MDSTKSMIQLSTTNNNFTTLIDVPKSNKVKINYGIGMGASNIGETSAINDKLLLLTGKGDPTMGSPNCMCLLASMQMMQQLWCPTDTSTQAQLQGGTASAL
eukprot:6391989-Ditylum_brightwellii.AAC.1